MTRVSTDLEGERIDVLRVDEDGPIELAVATDTEADVRQWFAFSVESDEPEEREVLLTNARDVTFGGAWDGYDVHVLHAGRRVWSRAETSWDGDVVRFLHRSEGPRTRYAYFAPYSTARVRALVRRASRSAHVREDVLGVSLLGRPLHRLVFGDPEAARAVWLVARQHPGETPASWAAEGLVRAAVEAPELFEDMCLHVVPLANPDGAALGNMRTNAAGADPNRSWDEPDEEAVPEVASILRALRESGCHLFLDVHADESCGYGFASLCEGNPSWDERLGGIEQLLADAVAAGSPDFVAEPFYEVDAPGAADLSIAANHVGETFGCPAATLELPMKASGDGRVRPGFSPARARHLGAAILRAIHQTLEHL